MFNKVILAGNLTRDIELRYLSSGTAVGSTAIATNRKYKSQSGEQKEEICFIDIVFFGRTAEIANQYLRKGSKVLVEGRLKFEQWTDGTGQKRSKHLISVETLQMLGTNSQNERKEPIVEYQYEPKSQTTQRKKEQFPKKTPKIDIDEDEIPF